MTHIGALKFSDEIILFADTAVTTDDEPMQEEVTSFGQVNRPGDGKTVVERQMKIAAYKNVAIAFTGRVWAWSIFRHSFEKFRKVSPSEVEAVQNALKELTPSQAKSLKLIVISNESERLQVFAYDGNEHQKLGTATERVWQYGSIPDANAIMTDIGFRVLDQPAWAPHRMAYVLAALQGYTIHDDILSHGVGGAYTCLRVTNTRIEWQPRIAFLLTTLEEDGDLVFCIMSEEVLFVHSPLITRPLQTNVIRHHKPTAKWVNEQINQNILIMLHIEVDYFIILRTDTRLAVIVEVQRQREGRHFKIGPTEVINDKVRHTHTFNDAVQDFLKADQFRRLLIENKLTKLMPSPIEPEIIISLVRFEPGPYFQNPPGRRNLFANKEYYIPSNARMTSPRILWLKVKQWLWRQKIRWTLRNDRITKVQRKHRT